MFPRLRTHSVWPRHRYHVDSAGVGKIVLPGCRDRGVYVRLPSPVNHSRRELV